MHGWHLAVYALGGLIMSVFSGVAGAGGGFIMTPLAILLGLTPAQAISSGKFNGLAVTVGSLTGLREHARKVNKKHVGIIMALAFMVGLLVPYVIRAFNNRYYQLTLGVILLLLIPVMVLKKVGVKPHTPTPAQRGIGGVLLTGALFLQGAFSGGLGTLVNVVLMGFLGMTANEAHVTKRWSQIVLNVTIIFGVFGDSLIVWPAVAAGASTTLIGSYIGGRIAVRKGNEFVMKVMICLMALASAALIIDAISQF